MKSEHTVGKKDLRAFLEAANEVDVYEVLYRNRGVQVSATYGDLTTTPYDLVFKSNGRHYDLELSVKGRDIEQVVLSYDWGVLNEVRSGEENSLIGISELVIETKQGEQFIFEVDSSPFTQYLLERE